MLMCASRTSAQTSASPAQRIELSFLIGGSRPSIVVEEPAGLRPPPTVRENDESYRAITQDVTARIWWTRRMSTSVGGGWSTDARRAYEFPRPAVPPQFPFSHYESRRTVAYHNRIFSVAQAWDLAMSGPIVPFIGGGMEVRWVVRRQDSISVGYVDPSSTFSSSTERAGRQIAALATAGMRILEGPHLSIIADGCVFGPAHESGVESDGGVLFRSESDTALGRITWRWRAGIGVRF